ncbi:MAG: electron transfer flavoprotein subunit beta/FixA family protein [Archaeoglobaceae archaeon]|nr:electron transfer flavoprotein subunit beta/FixA family protein [Archaeoglobaceae archaeon]MCX8152595.1 electron transfer flavoprotein subunit beta/FixA family protein [Archaeoglobaceae archaeon]MDW8014123.1 electron transfer flavoprotein subunit beta/FixA family protein [Archaeoglobaceae archaeon]
MKVFVLAKHAADPESEIKVSSDGKNVETSGLIFDINDWDRYAIEEGIRIKEKIGGEVVVVGVGKNCDDTLRKCLAMGADRAIKIPVDTNDAYQIAELIKKAIEKEKFDLIIAGYMSQDMNYSLVGALLAGMLNLPFATAVTSLKIDGGKVVAVRELEGGYKEEVELQIPCLITVQSGINEPRYVSVMGIKRARTKEIREVKLELPPSAVNILKIYPPPIKLAEILTGDASQIAAKIVEIVKSRGLI